MNTFTDSETSLKIEKQKTTSEKIKKTIRPYKVVQNAIYPSSRSFTVKKSKKRKKDIHRK